MTFSDLEHPSNLHGTDRLSDNASSTPSGTFDLTLNVDSINNTAEFQAKALIINFFLIRLSVDV